jgi:hypothetical protein
MVASEATSSLAALSNAMASSISRETHENGQRAKLLQGTKNYSGLDLEKESRPPVDAELFS